jgi:hypothetical protein
MGFTAVDCHSAVIYTAAFAGTQDSGSRLFAVLGFSGVPFQHMLCHAEC